LTHEELLSTISFFEDAPKEVVDRIGKHVQTVELNRGDVLFREADKPTDLYVAVSSRVVVDAARSLKLWNRPWWRRRPTGPCATN